MGVQARPLCLKVLTFRTCQILKDTSTMYTINLLILISLNLVRSQPVDNKLTDQCKNAFFRCCDTSSSIIPYRCFELNKCTPQFIKPENYLKICKEIHGNDTVNEEDTKGLKDEENAQSQIFSNNQRDDTMYEEDTKGLKDVENAQSQISSNNQRDDTMINEDNQKFVEETKRDYYPSSSPK